MGASLIGNILFSSIGFIAFIYGKKMAEYRTMCIGLVLMVYSYVVPNNFWLYAIGCALTVGLFIFKD